MESKANDCFEKYTMEFLIERIQKQQEGICKKKRFRCDPPIIQSINKKTVIMNFQELWQIFNRSIDDVKLYIDNELECTSSIFGETNMLSINNTYPKEKIEGIITNYIRNYVVCHELNCYSGNTIIIKKDRQITLQCNDCKSHRTVPVIRKRHTTET